MIYKKFNLPNPTGYFMLVEMMSNFDEEEGTKATKYGSIIIPEKVAQQDNYMMCKAKVLAQGLDCYGAVFKDKVGAQKPWCKVGDEILIQSHSGRNIPVDGAVHGKFQMITDQSVCGTYSESTTSLTK